MLLNRDYLGKISQSDHMDLANEQEQVLTENHSIYFAKKTYDLFLSHSYLDKTLVYTIVDLFNNAGYSVYVDWMVDTQLDRSKINRSTAETLCKRMDTCRGLAYISTANITNSKWCPWELGYVDGRTKGRCAILPVLDTSKDTFKGQEYLSIYPYIDYEILQGGDKKEFWVNDPQDNLRYTTLKAWLSGHDLNKHE